MWLEILNRLKNDANVSKQPVQLHLAFLSSTSRRFSAVCKDFKQHHEIDTCHPKPTDFTTYFAANGYLSCLVYARENECQWDAMACSLAAKNGHLNCLKYLHENGCDWDELTCANAAKNGHLEVLKYAHENGCRWTETTCSEAAENGHLDCLKYAHENGCEWNETTCKAALNGHLARLNSVYANGCQWNEWDAENNGHLFACAKNNHLDCLKYAHENGCPCAHFNTQIAIAHSNLTKFRHLRTHHKATF